MMELEHIQLLARRIADLCDEEVSIDVLDYIIDDAQRLIDDAAVVLVELTDSQGMAR